MPRKEDILELLKGSPDDPFLLYGLAMAHLRENDVAKAVEAFDRVLAVDPAYCPAHFHKARAQISLGQGDAARETLRVGMDQALRKGDLHTREEMAALLEETG